MELVEREELLAQLCGFLADARAGSGRQVLVGGEAGVGKTVLVRAFVESLGSGARVLSGSCDPLSTPRPLAPFHEMEPIADLLSRESRRHELLTAILGELELSTVMVIEDAHWADEATLDALRFVGRRVDRTRSLVLVTYRDDELGGDHPLRAVLGDLATARGVERLTVPPLTLAGVAALAAWHGFEPAHLHRVTGGNPFYVTEVLAAPGWTVPATVSDAVLARASNVSLDARGLLDLASLSPSGVETVLAEALLPSAGRALDECAERGLLVTSGERITFRHELARLAIEDAVPPGRRRDLHRRLLATLENTVDADPARLAHHADAAGDAERIRRYAPAAAREASSRGAHREAARQYERAVAPARPCRHRSAPIFSPRGRTSVTTSTTRRRSLSSEPTSWNCAVGRATGSGKASRCGSSRERSVQPGGTTAPSAPRRRQHGSSRKSTAGQSWHLRTRNWDTSPRLATASTMR